MLTAQQIKTFIDNDAASQKKQFARVTQRLLERDVHLISRIVPQGDHCEACWEKQIPLFMELLLYGMEEE